MGLIQLFFLLRGATPSLRLVLAVADAPSAGPHSPVRPPARKAVLCTYLSRGLPKSRGVSPDSRLGISGDLLGDFHSCWEHPQKSTVSRIWYTQYSSSCPEPRRNHLDRKLSDLLRSFLSPSVRSSPTLLSQGLSGCELSRVETTMHRSK